jgi:hypothetical protein
LSTIRLYLDADSSITVLVRALRATQMDVETAADAGLRTAPDESQIAHVLAYQRVLVTGDHYLRKSMENLTRMGGRHAGVLFLPTVHRANIGRVVESLRLIRAVCTAEEMHDQVWFIPL